MTLSLRDLPMPLLIVPSRPMDDEALLRFSTANELYRIERTCQGELRVMSPTGSGTGESNAYLNMRLGLWTIEDGRGTFFDSSTGFTLPDGSVLSTDAAWVDKRRWLALSVAERRRFAPICPEFVIELRSESDKLTDLQAKMENWLANGTEVAWLIDPLARTVSVYRPGAEPETYFIPSSVQGSGPVAGFELVMSWVWGLEVG